jgi:Fic family protein
MFIPEYSITTKILKNISVIEYAKAVIENTPILPSWESQLKKEAKVLLLHTHLKNVGLNIDQLKVKSYLDNIDSNAPLEFSDLLNSLNLIDSLSQKKEFTETEIREIAKTLTHKGGYRDTKISNKPNPEELLAKIVQFFDWLQSLDGKETHPVIVAAITRAFFEKMQPFKSFGSILSGFISMLSLNTTGYDLKNLLCIENYFEKTRREYDSILNKLSLVSTDFTPWIEYFTEGMSVEASNIKEKVKLLARDTKIAKATGRAKFTSRQERIVEYLQDYGVLQNKDFAKVFPDTSEDSILRDLKILIGKGVIQKSGSTKSSMYELA